MIGQSYNRANRFGQGGSLAYRTNGDNGQGRQGPPRQWTGMIFGQFLEIVFSLIYEFLYHFN